MSALKVKEFPGLQRVAPETIEKHEMEQALRDAQFALDVQLHDLRTEFLQRESKLRQEYLDRVASLFGEWDAPRPNRPTGMLAPWSRTY